MLKALKVSMLLPIMLGVAGSAVTAETLREHEIGSRAFAFHDGAARRVMSSDPSEEARNVVQRIMSAIGLVANFQIRAAPGVANAMAIVENSGKDRFILYDPNWMEGLQETVGASWPQTSILAHEIGHHLQFHMDPDFGNHEAELQADYFSGFIVNKLGASLPEAQLAMAMISSEAPSETHPARDRRVQEIARGWKAAADNQGANLIKPSAAAPAGPGTAAGPAEQRVALLIGNSSYKTWPVLKNPKNDVIAVQRQLRKLGFSTTILYDGTSEQIAEAVRLFGEDAKGADWAMFYFAGSGVEVDGVNYMIPVDADKDSWETFLRDHPQMRLDYAFEAVRSAKTVRIVVADACRTDPSKHFDVTASSSKPTVFKVIEPPHGVLVAYSTSAGQSASDGVDNISPYAHALIKALGEPGIELDKVFWRVSADVVVATQGTQIPSVLGNWPAQDLYLTRR